MCYIPGATELAIGSLVASSASAMFSFMGAQQQANDVNATYKENAANSIIGFQNDIEASQMDHMASQEESASQQMQMQRDGLVSRSAALAEGSARGIGGLSMSAIHRAIGFNAGENVAYAQRNSQLNEERARMGLRATSDTAKSRINSAPTARSPSVLALGAQLGGGVLNAYTMRSNLMANDRAAAGQIASNNARISRGQ